MKAFSCPIIPIINAILQTYVSHIKVQLINKIQNRNRSYKARKKVNMKDNDTSTLLFPNK